MNPENKYPDTLAEAREVAQPILDMGAVSVDVKMSWGKVICIHRRRWYSTPVNDQLADGRYTDEEVH